MFLSKIFPLLFLVVSCDSNVKKSVAIPDVKEPELTQVPESHIHTTATEHTQEHLHTTDAQPALQVESTQEELKQSISFKNRNFLSCLVSPDGKYILTTKEGNIGLEVHEIASEKKIASIAPGKRVGYGAQWSRDSQRIFYREMLEDEIKVYVYELSKKQSTVLNEVNPNALQSYALATDPKDPIISLNMQTLQVQRINLDGTNLQELTHDQGQYYNPLLAPNKKDLVVQEGSKMYLISSAGGERKDLGDGIASCWSPDSKTLYYFMDESKDGHVISGSEVYSYHVLSGKKLKLTNTSNIAEMWPSISQDGKTLFCTDEKTGSLIQIIL